MGYSLRRPSRRQSRRLGRRASRQPLAALTLLIAAGLVALAPSSAAGAVPIPNAPGPLLVPRFIGAPAAANPIASFPIPQNPFLAPDPVNNIHDDAYGTNSYPGLGPLGRSTKVTSAFYGVEECATAAFDSNGRMVGLCPTIQGPNLLLIDPATLDIKASFALPLRHLKAGENPLTDLCGGAYFYLDNQNRAVIDTTDRSIEVVADTGSKFQLVHTYKLKKVIPQSDCMIALMPDWSGRIWFVTSHGIVGDVDPSTSAVHVLAVGGGEIIDNSISVDETGGVFVVTDHAMYRFDSAPGTGAPVITWRRPYDRGAEQKPGQLAQGSGTTPTLVGPNLVAITDNADPQMHVLVYQRSTGQLVCTSPGLFQPGLSDTENSLVAVGNSLFVENNYGYKGPQSTLLGQTTQPGVSRVDIGASTCPIVWTSQEVGPTSVPKASLANGLLYVYTKPKNAFGVDAWYLTAIDIRTGVTAYSVLAGTGADFNNHYAAIYLGPDGTAYMPTLTGIVRFEDR